MNRLTHLMNRLTHLMNRLTHLMNGLIHTMNHPINPKLMGCLSHGPTGPESVRTHFTPIPSSRDEVTDTN
ncbi:hypothetical protein PtB15_3B305 [Puccinia triticina]|nr:hypothetical protein PtB15_3B305 [Puccinia triticina]